MECALTLIVGQESPNSPLKININGMIMAMMFSPDGKHLSSTHDGVQVWQVEDGKQIATMEARNVWCLAVSQHGRWIAAGTNNGDVYVWDAETREQVWSHKEDSSPVCAVDFSLDSTRLVTGSDNKKATTWDMATRKQVHTLEHEHWVRATKYSGQGDRLATGTRTFVRIWDNDGRLLVTINVGVEPCFNTGLLWSNNHLFALSDGQIKHFEASMTSAGSEWPIPDGNSTSCIALPKHKKFIAYSTNCTVTYWDTTTHSQCGLIEHTQNIWSIAISPDDQSLAIGGWGGNIIIRNLVSFVYC